MKDKLEAVRDSIAEKAPKVKVGVYAIDIQNHGEVDNAVKQAIADLGEIDILINNVRSSRDNHARSDRLL